MTARAFFVPNPAARPCELKAIAVGPVMRCFYVLVHGRLNWRRPPSPGDAAADAPPGGFYCHRYVLSSCEDDAAKAAFQRVRENLDRQTGWISAGAATLELEAEEVVRAPMHKLLKRDNRGHAFYTEE
jgi:hypothetical protein